MCKKYYYYYKWWLSDVDIKEGFYHSTCTTEQRPIEFLSSMSDQEFINELFVKQFKTEESMRRYWEQQQITKG